MKLLDNYDFLLGLIKAGGEDVVKNLVPLQNTGLAGTSSVIDALRNSFLQDSFLKDVLCSLWDAEGPYKDFNDMQKKVLLEYPGGIFFDLKDGSMEKVPAEDLKKRLYETYFEVVPKDKNTEENFHKCFDNEEAFEQIVMDTHFRYFSIEEDHLDKK